MCENEALRLRNINRDRLLHERVLGTRDERQAHAELMKRHPGMEHDEPHTAHVNAGQTGAITWTVHHPDDFESACLIPGHYETGMRGTIHMPPLAL